MSALDPTFQLIMDLDPDPTFQIISDPDPTVQHKFYDNKHSDPDPV